MTDGTRILRTAGIPVVIAIILLFMLPKMCAQAVLVSKARKEKEERAVGGLHIESSQKPVTYPAGLDPDRLRYLVEVDTRFSTPYTARVFKEPHPGSTPVEMRILPALQKLGYVEMSSDNKTLVLTRDGILHLDGLVDDGASWTFPLAKRQFDSVGSIDSDGNSAHALFAWQWQPTPAGSELMRVPKRHDAKVELTNAGGTWSLSQITDLDDELE